jgi:hypothetical protein
LLSAGISTSRACECPHQICLILLQRHVRKIQNGADEAAVCFKLSHVRETKIAEDGKKRAMQYSSESHLL